MNFLHHFHRDWQLIACSRPSMPLTQRTSARINTLQSELLCAILLLAHACGLDIPFLQQNLRSLTNLSLVCRSWAQAIQQEPRFWTSCQIYFGGSRLPEGINSPVLNAAERYFSCSGKLPLDLEVVLEHSNCLDHGHWQPMTEFIFLRASRWRKLKLIANEGD